MHLVLCLGRPHASGDAVLSCQCHVVFLMVPLRLASGPDYPAPALQARLLTLETWELEVGEFINLGKAPLSHASHQMSVCELL